MMKNIDENNFDALSMAWGAGGVDVDPKQVLHSSSAVKGGSNHIGFKNDEVDRLIDEARAELDKKKRIPLMRKVYKTIADAAPYVFMFNDRYTLYGHSSNVVLPKLTFKYEIGWTYWWSAKAK
jgi:peptide/nickel transport system substrate-binding protein/microcin C transport system substrate-binding protein